MSIDRHHPLVVSTLWLLAIAAIGFAAGRNGYVMLAVASAGFVHLRHVVRRHEARR